ncbi:hypothetical protein DPEC_G00229160 [Dallia pectoralis]|uniref:Uncharacterized protein n=1 Tax=Dallia pectoralis TaxID=75939 RepID=A0ACC2G1K1_DALPE|nr:hypothetical protein DPEC_G00229160 [Dallia pectoralis]
MDIYKSEKSDSFTKGSPTQSDKRAALKTEGDTKLAEEHIVVGFRMGSKTGPWAMAEVSVGVLVLSILFVWKGANVEAGEVVMSRLVSGMVSGLVSGGVSVFILGQLPKIEKMVVPILESMIRSMSVPEFVFKAVIWFRQAVPHMEALSVMFLESRLMSLLGSLGGQWAALAVWVLQELGDRSIESIRGMDSDPDIWRDSSGHMGR